MPYAEFKSAIRDGPTFILASPATSRSNEGGRNYLERADSHASSLPHYPLQSPSLSHGFDLTISQTRLKGATNERTEGTID